MAYSEDFSDVMISDPKIEVIESYEFSFDNDKWVLKRENNHWEIQFQSEVGEESIVVEREDFIDGKIVFDIDNIKHELLLEDFDRIEIFAKGLPSSNSH